MKTNKRHNVDARVTWIVSVLLFSAGVSSARSVYWDNGGAANSNWNLGTNWDEGTPVADDVAYIDASAGEVNPGLCNVAVSDQAASAVYVSYQSGVSESSGTLEINNGKIMTVSGLLMIGHNGDGGATGIVNQVNGDVMISGGSTRLGNLNSGVGIYNFWSGTHETFNLYIGYHIGTVPTAHGTYNVLGPATLTVNDVVLLGDDAGQNEGLLNIASSGALVFFGEYLQRETGTLRFTADTNGLSAIHVAATVSGNGSVVVDGKLMVDLSSYVVGEEEIVLIDNDGNDAISGAFDTVVLANDLFGYSLTYSGGDGNDLALVFLPLHVLKELREDVWSRFLGSNVYTNHETAPYIDSLFELVDSLIDAVGKDYFSIPTNVFMNFEVDRQLYEAILLLSDISGELDIVDKNTATLQYVVKNLKTDFGAVGNGASNDHPAFRTALEAAQSNGVPCEIFIPAGEYYLDGQWGNGHIYLLNQTNLIIRGEPGTVLVLPRRRGFCDVRDCENIQFRDLTIDFRPTLFSQGEVTAVGYYHNWIQVKIDEGYDCPTISEYTNASKFRLWIIDPDKGWVKDGNRRDINIARVVDVGSNFYNFWVDEDLLENDDLVTTGDLCAVIPRRVDVSDLPAVSPVAAFRSFNSQYVTLADVQLYGSMAYMFQPMDRSEGLKFIRTSFERMPETGRLACNLADGITGHDLARAPYFEKCRFASTYDDCMHFSSQWRTVLSVTNNQVTINSGSTNLYPTGEMVAIGNPNDLTIRDYGIINQAELVGGSVLLTLDSVLKSSVVPEGSQPAGSEADGLLSLRYNGIGLVARNSFLGLNRANGMRLKTPDALIESNVFARSAGATIYKGWQGDGDLGFSGFFPSHQIIRFNKSYNTSQIVDNFRASDGTPVMVPQRYCTTVSNSFFSEAQFTNDYPYFYWHRDAPLTLDGAVLLSVITNGLYGADIFSTNNPNYQN